MKSNGSLNIYFIILSHQGSLVFKAASASHSWHAETLWSRWTVVQPWNLGSWAAGGNESYCKNLDDIAPRSRVSDNLYNYWGLKSRLDTVKPQDPKTSMFKCITWRSYLAHALISCYCESGVYSMPSLTSPLPMHLRKRMTLGLPWLPCNSEKKVITCDPWWFSNWRTSYCPSFEKLFEVFWVHELSPYYNHTLCHTHSIHMCTFDSMNML